MTLNVLEDQRRVVLDGADIPLGARAFDVLAYLFTHSERIVSKVELLDHVWAGLIVEEGNLSVQIAGLRKAIGRERIKTVPGVGYRLIVVAEATASVIPLEVPSIPSLAVLPFANLTGQADSDYLVDGIVNEVISALASVSSFFVISSTSSFTYKGRVVDLADVGAELGVRYVLEGSIQQAGDSLRIFTQLVEADSGRMIWQDKFGGQMSDIFDLQDRVAEHVAGALEPKLIWAEAARATAKPTESLTAYDLCLKAAPLVYKQHSVSNVMDALGLLDQALTLDPGYLQAKALYCYAHTAAFATRWWTYEKARAALPYAKEVLDADPEDALSLCYTGHYIAYVGREYRVGLSALKRAAILNPNSATVAMLLGWVHIYLDENEAAVVQLERANRISPLHPNIAVMNSGIANAYAQMGDLEAAVGYYETARAEYPEFASNQIGLMALYFKLGRMEDAREMADWLARKIPDMRVSAFMAAMPQHNKDYTESVVNALRAFGFPD